MAARVPRSPDDGMKAILHVGLSLVMALAPALCCCNIRWLAAAATPACAACPICPTPTAPTAPKPKKGCCTVAVLPCCSAGGSSCCQPADEPKAETPARPTKPPTQSCCCQTERPDAAPAGAAVTVSKPERSADLLPLPTAATAVATPEHAGRRGGAHTPELAGVDARSAALFERHVLRC